MKKSRGFTLIELLIVIVIIGILAILIFLALQRAQKSARDAQRKAFCRDVATAEAMYYDANKSYGRLDDLTPNFIATPQVKRWSADNDQEADWNVGKNATTGVACNSVDPTKTEFCVGTALEVDYHKGFRCTASGCKDTP